MKETEWKLKTMVSSMQSTLFQFGGRVYVVIHNIGAVECGMEEAKNIIMANIDLCTVITVNKKYKSH